tara:strand:- start:13071 stop:14150 length:1080 start_codon:yes stop_codon:yes gene_type:complete
MNKINIYLFIQTKKYLIINIFIVSLFILFINILELSRVVKEDDIGFLNFLYLSFLKFPSILNEILPFVTITGVSFLIRNLINNNEFISMRNLGYSIFDIFLPIAIAVFVLGLTFLFFLNPLAVFMESKYDLELNNKDKSLYSIKITDNEMWIKNEISKNKSIFINIKNIDLKNMEAHNIKILKINNTSNELIIAKNGKIKENIFKLKEVKFYNFKNENFKNINSYNLNINFNEDNVLNSISRYKLIPFYKYIEHSKTLSKFNLYSPEIGLYYLSEVLKPIFIVVLSFVILGFTSKFQRNENFFKVLFIAISIGFLIFLLKEIISKLTINLSINFFFSYFIIFFIPLFIGLYQVIKVENE